MNLTTKKDSEIKMRISKTDKNFLLSKAQEQHTTLTDYILKKCLSNGSPQQYIPYVFESYNEIVHLINKNQNQQLTDAVNDIIQNCLSKISKEDSQA